MHTLEFRILETIKQQPNKPLTTSEIVTRVFPTAAEEIRTLLESPDRQYRRRAKIKKARLHRKLLYHLQKLVEDEILQVVGTKHHGEKLFGLRLREGEIEIRSGKKRIMIRKQAMIATPIDRVQGVVPFRRDEWLSRVNAVLFRAARFSSFSEAVEVMLKSLPFVNDAVGLYGAEQLMDAPLDLLEESLAQLEAGMKQYGRKATLLFTPGPQLVRFMKRFALFNPERVTIIFIVTPKQVQEAKEFFLEIIPSFLKQKIKLQFQNCAAHAPPIIYGDAGPYTLTPAAWSSAKHELRGCVFGGASITIDLARIEDPLHVIVRRAAAALFHVAVQRRLGFAEHLAPLRALGVDFSCGDEFIRFWNYQGELFVQEVGAAAEITNEFCETQERVYRACGMPIRFRIQLGSAFSHAGLLSERQYRKIRVRGLDPVMDDLRWRERLCEWFIGDRIRFFREAGDAAELFREVAHLMTFSLPSFVYDFSSLRGEMKLTAFLEEKR